jgi:lipopolysaccharide heptosyltransferase II
MKASAPAPADATRALVETLARRAFDAAVIFTVYSQSPLPAALACLLAGIPRRLAHCRENPYQLLTHWVPECEPEQRIRHEVRRQLDLVGAIGARAADERLALRVDAEAHARAERLLGAWAPARGDWAAIHPGASAPSRRYPPEGFAAIADGLAAAGVPVVFLGDAGERALVERIRGALRRPALSLAGRTDLASLAALLARAPVLVANNSGPAHVAAAVGTPIVSLYALTNPQHTPWGVPHRVLNRLVPCAFCYQSVCPERHHRCLRDVTPEQAVAAALELLGERRRAHALAPRQEKSRVGEAGAV